MSRVKFAFRLPALGSSQSLSIPDVFILGKEVSRPVLALPKEIDDQPVRWLKAGSKLPDDLLSKSGLTLASDDYVYFEMSDSQHQATWRLSEAESNPAEVLFAWAVFDEDSEGNTIGAINYWIDPKNHLDVALDLPKAAQLIGIQAGTNGAVWHASKPGTVRILMQPNYLPGQLRVLLRWPKRAYVAASLESFSVQLPVIDAEGIKQMPIAVLSSATLESVETFQEQATASQLDLRDRMAATQVDAMLADRWSKLLLKSLPVVSDLRADEFVGWMRNWSPEVVGLQGFQALTETSNASDNDRDTVIGFWNWYLEQTTIAKAELRNTDLRDGSPADSVPVESGESSVLFAIDSGKPVASTVSGLLRANADWYLVDSPNQDASAGLTLKFTNERQEQATTPLAIASILFSVVSGILYLLFQRLRNRTNAILAVHAWLYWAFLAALAWLLLPVAWPSIVIAISSIGMLAGQLMNSRRRQLAMRR